MRSATAVAAALAFAALPSAAQPAPSRPGQPPLVLPRATDTGSRDWIVAGGPGDAARALTQRHGARAIGRGVVVVPRRRARALAQALERRGLLRWAEPDRVRWRQEPTAGAGAPWRDRLGVAGLTPPPVTDTTPWLAILDSPPDVAHPAFAGGRLTAAALMSIYDLHGTATASVAGATGATGPPGVWPGMRIVVEPFGAEQLTCAQSALLLDRAVATGAAVVNMSYGSESRCFTELAALQHAARRGVLAVAAAGNERAVGNPLEYPAAFPHVLAVGALGGADAPAFFSNASAAIDVSAPGQDIPVAVPTVYDPDGVADGWAVLSGTSFAAPMVGAAATWVRAARPTLNAGQVHTLLCAGARDIGPRGWDRATGCGAVDLARTLSLPAPAVDPLEPNDDVVWVDGVGFGQPSRPVWRGGRRRRLRATVTAIDDTTDVYRVLMPPRSGMRVTVNPVGGGGLSLSVLDAGALDVAHRDHVLDRSRRPGAGIERVVVPNASPRRRVRYVVVRHDLSSGPRRTSYGLAIARAARRGGR